MRLRLFLLATTCAGQATLACPTAADMEQGVEVFFNVSVGAVYSTRFYGLGDGVIRSVSAFEDGGTYSATFTLGVFETSFEDAMPDAEPDEQRGTLTYGFDLPDKITPWTSYAGSMTYAYEGGKTRTHDVKYSFLGEAEVEIDACTYAVIDMDYVGFEPGNEIHGTGIHLPELGIDIETAIYDPNTGVSFTISPVFIQALP